MPFGPLKKITDPILGTAKNIAGLVDDVTGFFGSSAKEIAAGKLSYEGGKTAQQLRNQWAVNQMNFQKASSARQYQRIRELSDYQFNRQKWFNKTHYNRQLELNRIAYERSKHLSDTAYQRAMTDMRAAGLNPILAYKQGGASSPSIGPGAAHAGSVSLGSPGLQSGTMAPVEDYTTAAISSAQNVKSTAAQVDKVSAEIDFLEKRGIIEIQRAGLTAAQTKATIAAFRKTLQETLNLEQVYEMQEYGIGKAEAEEQVAKVLAGNAKASGATNIGQLIPGLMGQIGRTLERLFPNVFQAPKY